MMKSYLKCVAFALAWVAVVAGVLAQGFKSPRTFDTSADVLQAADTRIPLEWYQAETIRLDHHALKGQAPFDLSSTNQMMLWEVTSTTDVTVTYIISTGTAVQASNGWFRWTLTPNQANLTAGVYRGWLRVVQTNMAGVVTNQGVLAVQEVTVNSSPDASLYDFVGPISGTGFLRRIYVNGVLQNSTNYDAFLNVSTNGGGTGSTEVVVSGDTNWLTVATVGVTNTVTPSARATNAMAEAELVYAWGDWRLGLFGASSSLFGTLTNGVLRTNAVTGTHIADGTISNVDLALNAVAGSNLIDGTVMGADIGTGTVAGVNIAGGTVSNAQLSGNAVAGTNLIDGTVMGADIGTGTVAGVNIAGGTVSNAQLSLNAVAGSNIVGGAIGNQHMAASSVASSNVTDGSIGTNDAALSQWDGRYLMQTGGTVAGRATIAAAAQGTNALSVRNTQTPGAGVDVEINSSSSDYMLRLSRGATEEYRFSPTLADFGGNDLVDVGGASFTSITSGWFNGDGAGVTNVNAQTLDGIDSTGLTTVALFELLNEAAIVGTNPHPQRVISDFNAAALLASSNIYAACTNCTMGTNVIGNGDFASGGAYWTFGGGVNSNGGQVIASANGTMVQSNQIPATPGVWFLEYTNNPNGATGSVVVSWGGVEHVQAGVLTGYQSWVVGPVATNGFSVAFYPSNGVINCDSFSLRQIQIGSMAAAYGSFGTMAADAVLAKGAADVGSLGVYFTNRGYISIANSSYFSPLLGGGTTNSFAITGKSAPDDSISWVARLIGSDLLFGGIGVPTSTNTPRMHFLASTSHFDVVAARGGLQATGGVPVLDGSGRLFVNVATNPGAADGSALVKRGTNYGHEVISASVTGVFDSGVTTTHSPTNYPNGTNLLVTLAGVDAVLGVKMGTSNDSVTSAQIQGGAIGNAEMAAGAVGQSNIVAGSIGASRMNFTNAHSAGYVPKSSDSNTFYWAEDATGGGGAIGVGATNAIISSTVTQVFFAENLQVAVTGNQAWVAALAGSGGGGDYWQTNRIVVNEGATASGIIVTFTNNVAQRIPMPHVCYQNGLSYDTNTFGFNAPFSNHLYAAHWKANDGNGVNHGAIVYLARNGSQWNFEGQNTNNLSNVGCRFFSSVEGSDSDHGAFIGGRVLFRPQTNNQEFAVTVIIFSGGTWSLFNSQLEVEDLGPIVGSFQL